MRILEVILMSNNVDTIALGWLFKKIGNFDNTEFINRLIMQKQVYLLQQIGFESNYSFFWYIHGVYSKELAADGREISKFIDNLSALEDYKWHPTIIDILNKFYDLVDYDTYMNNDVKTFDINQYADNLEVLTSIYYLDNLNWDADLVFDTVVAKKENFTPELCSKMWAKLVSRNLIKNEVPK